MKKLLALITLTIFLVACSNNITTKASDPSVKEFRISMTHSGGYSPKEFTVNIGDTVRFLATSDPVSHQHGITIDEYGINVTVTRSSNEEPQVIEFVADKPGTFKIYCGSCDDGPFGPHPWMEGKLIVK